MGNESRDRLWNGDLEVSLGFCLGLPFGLEALAVVNRTRGMRERGKRDEAVRSLTHLQCLGEVRVRWWWFAGHDVHADVFYAMQMRVTVDESARQ